MTGIVDFRTELLDELGNPISASNPLPTTGGGGGGGGTLSDTVFVDSTGQLFVYRDTGAGVPAAFSIPTWAAYTPVGAVTVSPVEVSNTGASPVPVSGTFWPATQPVSGTVTANAGTGTFAVSAASLPLPTGAATEAKQPAIGTAGSASADVLTVQGVASMTPLKVDGSGSTQPISGTVNIGNTSASPVPVTDPQIADMDFTLTRVLNALNAPQGYDKSLQRQRGTVVVESGTVTTVSTVTTVTTVTTVSTVTNLSTIDTLQGRIQVYGANLSAWADTTRARIT